MINQTLEPTHSEYVYNSVSDLANKQPIAESIKYKAKYAIKNTTIDFVVFT